MKIQHTKAQLETLKSEAKILFTQNELTLKEIGRQLGLHYNTVSRWAAAGEWKNLLQNSTRFHENNLSCLVAELAEINQAIRQKPAGQRYPTLQQARIRGRLMEDIFELQGQVDRHAFKAAPFSFVDFLKEKAG